MHKASHPPTLAPELQRTENPSPSGIPALGKTDDIVLPAFDYNTNMYLFIILFVAENREPMRSSTLLYAITGNTDDWTFDFPS